MIPDTNFSEIPASQKHIPPKPFKYFNRRFKDRVITIINAYQNGGYSMVEVGKYFGLCYSTISRIIQMVERQMARPDTVVCVVCFED